MANVTIIGSGFIGRAWAISYARAGHDIVLWDADEAAPTKAVEYIQGVLPTLAEYDLLDGQTPAQLMARLSISKDLSEALSEAIYVQENTPENLTIKCAVFADLDQHTPADAIIASSTSALLPSSFTETMTSRARCLVVHPINPPYLVPAAEVVPAPWTDPAVVERTRDFLLAAGHAPIVMQRELDGFVMNRMQGALLEEAFRLVADGYASIEDIDVGIREGLALRWSFMGPFETIDLNAPGGVRDYAERYQSIYQRIFPSMQRRVDWAGTIMNDIEQQRRQALPAEQLVNRQVWRDRRLMALAAHKRRADKDIGK